EHAVAIAVALDPLALEGDGRVALDVEVLRAAHHLIPLVNAAVDAGRVDGDGRRPPGRVVVLEVEMGVHLAEQPTHQRQADVLHGPGHLRVVGIVYPGHRFLSLLKILAAARILGAAALDGRSLLTMGPRANRVVRLASGVYFRSLPAPVQLSSDIPRRSIVSPGTALF